MSRLVAASAETESVAEITLEAMSFSCFTCASVHFCKNEMISLWFSSLHEAESHETWDWKVSKDSEAVRKEEIDLSVVLINRIESSKLCKEEEFKVERISRAAK